ncbi:MAG: hypothetical protein RL015_2351 [Verrucomicrobiota bacterium]
MDFTGVDREIEAFEDFAAGDLGVEGFNFEGHGKGGKMGDEGLFGRAGIAGAVDGEVGAGDAGAFGQVPKLRRVEIAGRMGVDDLAAGFAVEMDVFVEIGAVARLAAFEVDKLDEARCGQMIQAVINRGQGDVRGAVLHPSVEVRSSRVIRGGGEHLEDLPTVRGQAGIFPEHGQAAVEAGRFGWLALGRRRHEILELE